MDPAEAQLLCNTVAALQQQLTALQNAAPAAGAAVLAMDAAALAAAISSARQPKDHSKDLDYIKVFSAEGTMRPDDFIKNVKGTFDLKSTPEADKVSLVVPRLSCKALSIFKAFKNAAGDINDSSTTTWPEFKQLMLGPLLSLSHLRSLSRPSTLPSALSLSVTSACSLDPRPHLCSLSLSPQHNSSCATTDTVRHSRCARTAEHTGDGNTSAGRWCAPACRWCSRASASPSSFGRWCANQCRWCAIICFNDTFNSFNKPWSDSTSILQIQLKWSVTRKYAIRAATLQTGTDFET
eukprot:828392-Rhodomonas_salina.1